MAVEAAGSAAGAPDLADLAGVRRAGYLWGLADAAVTGALERVRLREQFGRPIGSHQAVAFPLAALTARLRAARLLTHYTAWLADGGRPPPDEPDKRTFADRVADVLRHNADLALDAAWCGLHLHGAHGLTEESPAQLLYRRVLFHTALARPAADGTA
jgi:alkylation response protein AidB-like acyl-CoA dehydrogenase